MSNYHILDGGTDGNRYRVVFHIPIPSETNDVAVNLRTALTQFLTTTVSQVPHVTGAEQTQLDAGELYEHTWAYATHPGLTLAQKRDELDAKFTTFSTSVLDLIRARLKYWGYNRDVS